jgi:hypothetical protein
MSVDDSNIKHPIKDYSTKKRNIRWGKDVLPAIGEQLKLYTSQLIPLTLRGMFYILISLNVLENLPARYNYLSKFTTRMRESGVLHMNCFVDDGRYITDINDTYHTVDEYLHEGVDFLENAKTEYKIPRWHNQPHYVEVWVEKNAMRGILDSIINTTGEREVRIVPTSGQESVSFAWENVRRLRKKQRQGKQVHIRYFGDLDPSGESIERNTYEKIWLEPYDLEGVDWKRVGVTNEQRIKWNLIPNTDPKTMAKLKRDKNRFEFMRKYGELFQIEVDALQAIKPEDFKGMVLGCVDEFFNQDIYEQNKSDRNLTPTKRMILESVQTKVLDLNNSVQNQLMNEED